MKLLRLSFLLFLVLLLAGGGLTAWAYRELHTPIAHTRAAEYIEIPRGFSPQAIINRLHDAGVIGRSWPVLLYLKLTGAGSQLKAGEYRFPSPISPLEVVRKLEEGQQRLSRLTVIEGWTRWDIAAALTRLPELKLQDAGTALRLLDDAELIRDLDPQATNLEGYLYPDTYSFPPSTTAPELVGMMVRRFREVWAQVSAAYPPLRTTHEAVAIASLIETEGKLLAERPLISSVIFNRLQRGIPLGIDSTVIYAAKLAGTWKNDGRIYQSDLDRVSPYNTRKVVGLPPGPVASPGRRSLEAALNPAQTDYIYYVRNPGRDDGAHNFYTNEGDFWQGVQALRHWERTRAASSGSSK